MSESYPLATEPEGVVPSLVERFNSGKVSTMVAQFEPGGRARRKRRAIRH